MKITDFEKLTYYRRENWNYGFYIEIDEDGDVILHNLDHLHIDDIKAYDWEIFDPYISCETYLLNKIEKICESNLHNGNYLAEIILDILKKGNK